MPPLKRDQSHGHFCRPCVTSLGGSGFSQTLVPSTLTVEIPSPECDVDRSGRRHHHRCLVPDGLFANVDCSTCRRVFVDFEFGPMIARASEDLFYSARLI